MNKTVVCCSTCFNDNCKYFHEIKLECLDKNSTRNPLLYWSEETGYLPKMNGNLPYINWKGKPDFIRKEEIYI